MVLGLMLPRCKLGSDRRLKEAAATPREDVRRDENARVEAGLLGIAQRRADRKSEGRREITC